MELETNQNKRHRPQNYKRRAGATIIIYTTALADGTVSWKFHRS